MPPASAHRAEPDSPERARKLAALRERDPDWHDAKAVAHDRTLLRPPYYIKPSSTQRAFFAPSRIPRIDRAYSDRQSRELPRDRGKVAAVNGPTTLTPRTSEEPRAG